jgi:galactose mutarotase-like enzyme
MVGTSLRFGDDEVLAVPGGLKALARGDLGGLPLLAPWANRLGADRYRASGVTVDLAEVSVVRRDANGLPIHGCLGGRSEWELQHLAVEGREAVLVTRFAFGEHEDLLAAFPYPHDLLVEVRVAPREVGIITTIRPRGDRAVPVTFGWHPYFRLAGARRDSWRLVLPPRERIVLDDRCLPTRRAVREDAEAEPLERRTFDDLYRLGRDRRLGLEADGRRLVLEQDARYPFAQVWAPPGGKFVCLEPMTAPVNALGTGRYAVAAPGRRVTARFEVRLERVRGR